MRGRLASGRLARGRLSILLVGALITLPVGSFGAPSARHGSQTKQNEVRAVARTGADDPDLPLVAHNIDKAQFLKLREEYTNLLRGVPYHLPYNPRARAIQEMKRAESSLERERAAKASGQNNVQLTGSGWTPIGPAPVPKGQTVGTPNPVSGRTTAIVINPTNPDIVYAGTAQGGVYRTLDGGATWTALFDQAETLAIGSLALSPLNPTTLFVGTGEENGSADSFFGVGVYVVRNAETTADLSGPFNSGSDGSDVFTRNAISKIVVDPLDDNTIFVSTGPGHGGSNGAIDPSRPLPGLFRSTNALGDSPAFAKLDVAPVFDLAVNDVVLDPGNPNNLVCFVLGAAIPGSGGIWRTTDALDPSPAFSQVLQLGARTALAATKNGNMVTMFAATGEDASSGSNCRLMAENGQLRKSTDGGATWSAPLPAAEGFCGGQCRYDIAVAVDPSAPARVYIGGSAESSCSSPFKRSTDGGTTFSSTDDGLHADMHSIVIAPSNPSIIYTGNDGGIFRSTDRGATWQSLNNPGFSATQFQSIAVHPTDPNFFIGGTQDNGSLVFDSNRDWRQIDFGDGGYTLIDQNAANTKKVLMYHTYFNVPGTFLAFATIGSPNAASAGNWTVLGCGSGVTSNGIGCSDTAVLFYAPMALGPGNPNTVYFGTDRLYRSAKKGKKMKAVSQGPIVHGVPISSIGISPQNDNIRIVGVADGEVFASTDGSSNMTEVTSPDFPSEFVARAVIDPHDSNTAYVTFSGFGDQPGQHVWKTSNLGGGASTWAPAGNGIPDVPVSAFVIDPANSNNLYAGTDIGVFRSTDGGSTWIPFSEGLPKVAVFDMAIQPSSRTLRIATHGRGVWERAIP